MPEVLYCRLDEGHLRVYFEKLEKLYCEINDFFYNRRFFVRQTFLLKCINLQQQQQMPKTYGNIKLDFHCVADAGFQTLS